MYKARLEDLRMKKLELNDQRHLEGAQGWLGLGNWLEANEELEQITPQMRAHPDVLLVRWHVYATAKKWEMAVEVARAITKLLPENSFGWVHWAFSLHELKRTKEAWGVLVPVVDKFPDEYIIRYNLACYACQLGNLKEAWQWLEKAFDFGDSKNLKLMALDDHDLEPLWIDISEI
jgi:tetratricopeptide (TPR) repeat protein